MARVVLTFQRSKDVDNPEAMKWLKECETRLNVELLRISTELTQFGAARLSVNVEGDKPLQVVDADVVHRFRHE